MRVCAFLLSVLLLAPGAAAKDKPDISVRFAKSWEAAIDEARALNLPLVIHRHGFY